MSLAGSGLALGLGLGFNPSPTTVIQVTNLSAAVTSEQMNTLFSFLGDIEELRLYPPDNAPLAFSSKVCYIKYRDPASVGVAQHLTNTVFIDRALIVVPCAEGKIPEEAKALSLLAPAPTLTSLLPGAGLLPIPTPTPTQSSTPAPLTSLSVTFSTLGAALPATLDPNLAALGDIPQPPLMGNVDPSKVDEIRRTIYVGNLNSQTTTAEQLLEFFKQVGEVKFVRMAGDETQPTRFAFVEFADQNCVPRALAFNGVMFGDRPLKINHSNNAIVKPPELTPQAAAKELEEVMKRVREAQSFISAAIEPESGKSSEKKSVRSHSQTHSRSRSRSKSRSRRKRSRSKHRSRSRNRSRSRHKERRKSKSPHRKRSRSKERRKSRSRSRDKKKDKENKVKVKERERSKERDDKRTKEKRSRTPSKSHSAPKRSRSMSRERHRRKSKSPSRSPKTSKAIRRKSSRSPSPRRNKKEKKKEKEKEQSSERKEREQSRSKKKSSKEKDIKDKIEKNDTSLKENDNSKEEQNTENNKELELEEKEKEAHEEDEEKLQQNGNCQLTEENIPCTTEVV